MGRPTKTAEVYAHALRLTRREAKVTQAQLAANAGVSTRTVIRWEQGRGEPSDRTDQRKVLKALEAARAGDWWQFLAHRWGLSEAEVDGSPATFNAIQWFRQGGLPALMAVFRRELDPLMGPWLETICGALRIIKDEGYRSIDDVVRLLSEQPDEQASKRADLLHAELFERAPPEMLAQQETLRTLARGVAAPIIAQVHAAVVGEESRREAGRKLLAGWTIEVNLTDSSRYSLRPPPDGSNKSRSRVKRRP